MSRLVIVVLFFVVVVFGGLFWYFSSREPNFIDRPKAGENIIAFGNSLVEGIGASQGNDFVSILSRQLGLDIINAGRSGDTTISAFRRIEQDVLSKEPRVVMVLLGGNDALRRISVEETFQNLGTMIDKIHEKGAGVLLIGIRGGIFSGEYKKEFRKLAREKEVSYVSDVLDGIFGHPKLMFDPIHPNDTGYALMAGRIEPVLRKMISE